MLKSFANTDSGAGSPMNLQAAQLTVAEPYLIEQDWAAYTREQHAVWAELVSRRMPHAGRTTGATGKLLPRMRW